MLIKITEARFGLLTGAYDIEIKSMERLLNGTVLYCTIEEKEVALFPQDYLRIKQHSRWRAILKNMGYKKVSGKNGSKWVSKESGNILLEEHIRTDVIIDYVEIMEEENSDTAKR